MEDIIAILLIFGGGTLFLLSISPVGRAIADRIRNSASSAPSQALDQLRESQATLLEELDQLRHELTEVEERVDFAERLLAQQREVRELPGESRSGS